MSGSEIDIAVIGGSVLLILFSGRLASVIADAEWFWVIVSVLGGAFVGMLLMAVFFVPYGPLWQRRAIPSDVIGGVAGACFAVYNVRKHANR